jgi:catechol 2,3-dioxygenase-like lactoylglutathione lyase family enzyme
MTIQRMDHVGIVVDDLAAAIVFFVELGLVLQARGPSKVAGWTASWGSRTYGRTLR